MIELNQLVKKRSNEKNVSPDSLKKKNNNITYSNLES